MLFNTFCHLPKIGQSIEKKFWDSGIRSWDDFVAAPVLPARKKYRSMLRHCLDISRRHLEQGNPLHFQETLPADQIWRLYGDFRHNTAFLDIETTGLNFESGATITTIAVYDGADIYHYVQGDNLYDFPHDIQRYDLLVTYNGKQFDIPFTERYFLIALEQAHIDLRYVLRRLGYKGGLKAVEKQMGLDRGELDGVDGFFAVLLWDEYCRTGNTRALETLLAYNIEDVVNLETLMVMAFNLYAGCTPFADAYLLPVPSRPAVPFTPDVVLVEQLKQHRYPAL